MIEIRRAKIRRELAIVGGAALCAAVAAPTQLADSRLTHWMRAFGGLEASLRETFRGPAPSVTVSPRRVVAAGTERTEARPAMSWLSWLPSSWSADAKWAADTPAANPAQAVDGSASSHPAPLPPDALTIALTDDRIKTLGIAPTNILEAVAAYRSDNLDAGDALAARIVDPLVRTALEWVALRDVPQKITLKRLKDFAAAHPSWPASAWLRHQMEAKLLGVPNPLTVETFFTSDAPETPPGKLALALALRATGRVADGTKLARAVFRESDLSNFSEGLITTAFGNDLTRADYKYRADRLLYDEKVVPALRYAAQAGPDVLALAKARAAVIADIPSDQAMAAVPAPLRKDPGFILAEVQRLRRADKLIEAAQLMESAPHDIPSLIDGDEWWTERRVLARRLLDDGKINAAYIICAKNSAVSPEAKVEAEFHAGWIALRFMKEPARAAYHFQVAARLAQTPTSIARIAYWQGRTAEASADPALRAKADSYYRTAATHRSTYYGQLAQQALGLPMDRSEEPPRATAGAMRAESVRAIELLYAAGEKEAAYALALAAADSLTEPGQVAALAQVIAKQQDAHLALTIGKLIGQRGIIVDTLAFPTFGIPAYQALQNSAAPSVVYSVARQESAFVSTAISRAGAKGLMQMIDATARHTALKAGLPFDATRLVTDASFNAQLGAAHLGELMSEQGGSLILTFAAYNAGGGRVKQWIDAYGDPRKPGVDPIDWVERIPFTETRNYVQRVMANVTMYQALFANPPKTDSSTSSAPKADNAHDADSAHEARL